MEDQLFPIFPLFYFWSEFFLDWLIFDTFSCLFLLNFTPLPIFNVSNGSRESMASNNLKQIAISPENYETLKNLGRMGSTFDSVLTEC